MARDKIDREEKGGLDILLVLLVTLLIIVGVIEFCLLSYIGIRSVSAIKAGALTTLAESSTQDRQTEENHNASDEPVQSGVIWYSSSAQTSGKDPVAETTVEPTSDPATGTEPEPNSIDASASGSAVDPSQTSSVTPTQEPEPSQTSSVIRGISSSTIVYVSTYSSTIHSVSDCSGMENYNEMTLAEADSKGYQYCQNCW